MAELLSPEEVAAQCGLSRKAVYRAIERRELRASRLCSRLRIRSENVDSWITANEVGDATSPTRRRTMPKALPSSKGLRGLLAQADD